MLLMLGTLCFGLLSQSGCSRKEGAGGKERFLSITPLDHTRKNRSISGIAVVPIYKDGRLKFISGGTKTDRAFNISFGAFNPAGDVAWEFSAKYGDQNPRPYTGKSIGMNDRNVPIKKATSIGDVNQDGIDDLYAMSGTLDRHLVIISGADGKVIVQSEVDPKSSKAIPDDVVDLNNDGIKDYRFVTKQKSNYICTALSGKDLTEIGATSFQPDGHDQSTFSSCIPDQTGDGIREILLNVHSFQTDGGKKEQKLVVIDGKSFKVIRSITESVSGNLQVAKGIQTIGDINGDGVADFLTYSSRGANSNQGNGYVCVLDGSKGKNIWYLDGDDLGGPELELTSTPIRTKDTIVTRQVDNDLGEICEPVPDQNGDARQDFVIAVAIDPDMPLRHTLLLISGADGSILKQHRLQQEAMSPVVIPLVHPESMDQPLTVGVLGASTGPIGMALVEL